LVHEAQSSEYDDELADILGEDVVDWGTLTISSLDAKTALAVDLEVLSREFIEQSQPGESISLRVPSATTVIAVAADATVRYGYTIEDTVLYLLDLAGVEIW
jgi:hypothetical protein